MYEVDCFNLSASCQDKSIKGKKLGLQICPRPGTGPSFPSESGERETLVILVTRGTWPVTTPSCTFNSPHTGCQLRDRILSGKMSFF